jgi:flagellar hook-associated protein 2
MSSLYALSGIFSGIDTDTLVAAGVAAARGPLNRLTSQRGDYQAKTNAVAEIERRMEQFRDLLDEFRTVDDLRATTATSSDSDVLVAVGSGGATEGVHDVVVNQLASAEKEVHAGVTPTEAWTHSASVADADTEYIAADDISDAAGSDYKFVFQFGSEAQVSVDLSAYDATGITLNELVSEINTAAGYSAASAVEEGGGYKLRVVAAAAGEDKSLTITDDSSVGELDSTDDFSQTVDGSVGADAIVGAGQFVYTYDGVTRTITTSADTNLGQLRDLINNDAENPGLSASILEYEADADHKYHLVLSGKDTGGDYSIAVEAGTTLSGFGPGGNWTQTRTARDAQIRVDGYPADPNWIEVSGNTVTGVIPGVTLTLQDTGSVTVNLSRSTQELKGNIENLVGIYNGLVDTIEQYGGYDTETKTAGVLLGDSSLNLLLTRVRSVLTGTAAGFEAGEDTYTLPAQIGIEIDRDGYLSVDQAVLDEALSDDYHGVLLLIGAVGRGASDSAAVQFDSATPSTEAGTYEVKVDYDAVGTITAAWMRAVGETEWRSATVDGDQVIGAAGTDEQGLQVTFVWPGGPAGSVTAEVRVQQGFGGALYDEMEEMLDSLDGPLAIKTSGYETAIDQLTRRIEQQQERLEETEQRLREKYARLEGALAQLDSFRGAFESLMTSLATMNGKSQGNG